ncbi:MAG: fatty acid desaturase [Armatimonadetes bacterium]|nr:fatty acid desaturase [Armatimonadota bacterium]
MAAAVVTRDYSLTGAESAHAVEQQLAEAEWYASPVPREAMRELLERRDDLALRDTALWFGLLFVFGALGYRWWGSWWAILPFAAYGVIYGSSSDSRWHESLHGTAFKTDWLNNVLYEIASFMVQRESTVWRWSHMRHHSDTIIVGLDPEIAVPRPPKLGRLVLSFLGYQATVAYFRKVWLHCAGQIMPDEKTFIPESAWNTVYLKARIYLAIYAGVVALSLWHHSLLPLMYIGLPNFYGYWLMPIYGYTQHAGLAEDVLDHRLNCRTVYMNRVNRYLYWNMNYHVEHHMFPLVPYHNLPRLHELVKADMPPAYDGLGAAWREIIPALRRQATDPDYYVQRELPKAARRRTAAHEARTVVSDGTATADGWLDVAAADSLAVEDVLRFDVGERTLAVYRAGDGEYHATDGLCTHGGTHLATGVVMGHQIECPKHNGRFDVRDGSPQRAPVCVAVRTHPVRVAEGRLQVRLNGGA